MRLHLGNECYNSFFFPFPFYKSIDIYIHGTIILLVPLYRCETLSPAVNRTQIEGFYNKTKHKVVSVCKHYAMKCMGEWR
jgi:hypothetical protein